MTYAPVLPDTLTLGPVALRTRNLTTLSVFYQSVVGLEVEREEPGRVVLGAGGRPLVILIADANAPLPPARAPGLFHLAIRVPDRAALASRIAAFHVNGIRFAASDHIVSEALYLDDPDGNGIEIYLDRPRASWRWNHDEIVMSTAPLDLSPILAQMPAGEDGHGKMPAGTDMGHVHLKVNDLAAAERFWSGILGLGVTTRSYPGALFTSAGGYHHHVGLNVWHSGRSAPLDAGRTGLDHVTLVLPAPDVDGLKARLSAAGTPFAETPDGLRVTDPSGNGVEIAAAA